MVDFFFRLPKFPIIVRGGDGRLVAATSRRHAERALVPELFPGEESYDVIDARGEGFILEGELMMISPLTMKARWTKKEIIELYNAGVDSGSGQALYPTRSLSSKRLEQVVRDIAKLIQRRG